MVNKTIQMKHSNNKEWDNLYPITLTENVLDLDGVNVENKILNNKNMLIEKIENDRNDIEDIIKENLLTENHINIEVFNIKGDSTDKTIELNNVLKDGNIRLYFPKGEYLISDYLHLYSNTEIILHEEAILKRIGDNDKIFINGERGNDNYATGYDGESNITIMGGTINLNSKNDMLEKNKNITVFDLSHGENLKFKNIKIINGQNGHYFQLAGVRNVIIEECIFKDQFLTHDDNEGFEIIQPEVTTYQSFPTFGEYDLTPTRNVIIQNNVFDNVIRGVGTHGDTKYGTDNIQYCFDIKVINNVFKNIKSNAIMLNGMKDSKIINNHIENVGYYGLYSLNADNVQIENNIFKNIEKHGFQLTKSKDFKIVDNYLYNISQEQKGNFAGIRIDNVENFYIDKNKVFSDNNDHSFALYTVNTVNTKVITNDFQKGQSGTMTGSGAVETMSIQNGTGQTILYEGDLSSNDTTITLIEDLRNFNGIVVLGNANVSDNAYIVSMFIPKQALVFGAASGTGRFRLLLAHGESQRYQLDFSFPGSDKIRLDESNEIGHIRQVIGIH